MITKITLDAMEPNSPELWGRFWEPHSLNEQLRYLSDAENSVVWKAIQRQIDIPGKNIIEIGAGSNLFCIDGKTWCKRYGS